MRSMCLSLLAERPHAFKQFWGGTFCEGIITPPLLTLNMRDTEEHGSGVKVNRNICVKHRYIDQMGTTPCPECEEE